jgi:uncharacterized protein YqgC (DUF456 family)
MNFLVGVAIAVGLVGIVVPLLPGAFLVLGAIVVWAIVENSPTGWAVLVVAVVVIGGSQVAKYLIPARRLRDAGVPNGSLVVGGVLGIIGFFVIPVVGLFLGFPLGVYAAEWQRLGSHQLAWPSTRHAVLAVGLSLLIELAGALLAAAAWLTAVIVS